jgi:hypothetical protein
VCRPAVLFLFAITVCSTLFAQTKPQPATTASDQNRAKSQEELTQELSNPVTDIWFIVNEFDISDVKNVSGDWHIYNWNLQPILPIHLTKSWNLINRPYMPFFINSPTLGDKPLTLPIELISDSGIGDIGFVSLLSPNKPLGPGRGQFLWGVGPTFLFPTASKETFGFDKWQAGPAGVAAFLNRKTVAGAFMQQWWSYAGNPNRADKNFAWIQYFAAYQFAPGWQISTGAPIISVDWKNDNVTFPIGAGVNYTAFLGKLPVQFAFSYQKTLVHPDTAPYGDNLFRIDMTPVIPPLFGGKH